MDRGLMATLFCFGLGYSAQHFITKFGGRLRRLAGTVTTREKAAAIASAGIGGHKVEAFVFDGSEAAPSVTAALMDAAALLVSVPPGERDTVLAQFGDTIAGAPRLQSIVYLSTVGVYGDHAGAWVDETTPAAPVSARSRRAACGRAGMAGAWCARQQAGRDFAAVRDLWATSKRARSSGARCRQTH